MIIDISSYNGKIDFNKMMREEPPERIIMRGTVKSGELDTRLIENINGYVQACTNYNQKNIPLDIYKFSYARSHAGACVELYNLISKLKSKGIFMLVNTIWLDLEDFDGRAHTTMECAEIIAAYAQICHQIAVKFGVYCNYNYLTRIIPKWANMFDFWVARYNKELGDIGDFHVIMWQYTSTGTVAGITGNVDVSRYVV